MSLKLISLAIIGLAALAACVADASQVPPTRRAGSRAAKVDPEWDQTRRDVKRAIRNIRRLIREHSDPFTTPYNMEVGNLKQKGNEFSATLRITDAAGKRPPLTCQFKYTEGLVNKMVGIPKCHLTETKAPKGLTEWYKN